MKSDGDRYNRSYSQARHILPPPDPFERHDLLLAAGCAAFAFLFSTILAFPGLYPASWGELVVAAGLRPPETILPGLFRLVARCIYGVFGVWFGNFLMFILGKALLAADAFLMYYSVRGFLALTVRLRKRNVVWSRKLASIVSVMTAIAFTCADPVWRASQAFGSTSLLLTLTILSLFFFENFLISGHMRAAYFAMLAIGVLCAETPFGFFLLACFWCVYFVLLNNGSLHYIATLNPLVGQISKWYLTAIWAAGLVIGIGLNVTGFIALHGPAANGISGGDIPGLYITQLWSAFSGAASAGGWIIGAGVVLLPLLLSFLMARHATDEEYFLNYHTGILFFLCGAVSYCQFSAIHPLWFWTWIKRPEMIPSAYLQCAMLLMSALTLGCSLSVLVVEAFCRDHRRLASLADSFSSVTGDTSKEIGGAMLMRKLRRFGITVSVVLFVAGILPGRIQMRTRAMLSLMRDYVKETVRECKGAKWFFTDGSYDCAFELEAAARGRRLRCLSLIMSGSVRDAWIRQRAMEDAEDSLSASVGASNVLRTWQRDKKERLPYCALQLGLEVWKRAGLELPPCSGAVARPEGVGAEELARGIAEGHSLAQRVAAVYSSGSLPRIAGPFVSELFRFMQWRLARIARARAEIFDRAGDKEASMKETEISDALDLSNESLQRIMEGMAKLRDLTMRQMTPREGLQFALVRADFLLAKKYAEPVLAANPDDQDANFAMGMCYFMQEQFAKAEEYLMRCGKRNPKEPAVWNNIAVIQMRTGRFDEAMTNALRALSLIPDSAEVKDTVKQIEAAMEAAKTNTPQETAVQPPPAG